MYKGRPQLIDVREFQKGVLLSNQCLTSKYGWVPARPIANPSFVTRIKLAWMVFIGRADALTWPEQ